MKIFVINSGSSSVKYKLIDMDIETVLAKGLAERIGIGKSLCTHYANDKKIVIEKDLKSHVEAIDLIIELLTDKDNGVIESIEEIDGIGHRIVHGGEKFSESALINEDIIQEIEACKILAPLHNEAHLSGIYACQKELPDIPMVAVFDTSFHKTIPEKNYLYAIPYSYYEKYKIRKYGFHGISHKYVGMKAAEYLNKDFKDVNLITLHLGNGGSLTAIKNGKSYDTSMGFTPLAGIVMGSRCGDIDPTVVGFLMENEKLNEAEIDLILNKKSGLLGISGVSSDARDVFNAMNEGNARAKLALDIFINKIKQYIGNYIVQLENKIDAIVFTAGIGENSPYLRGEICKGLENFGIEIDESKNSKIRGGQDCIISKENSKVKIMVILTDEELMIARDTLRLIK